MTCRLITTRATSDFTRWVVEKYGAGRPLGGSAGSVLTARLVDEYGERATDSAYERGFYKRDVAPLPGAVDWVFGTVPDVVVRPCQTEEVAHVVALAGREGAAITVRAGGSTSLGGCVPVRGGVLLDLSALKGIVALDSEAKTIRVRSGTVWTELDRALAPHGLEPMAVPSSAPASTVGGWLCTGGYGIGSLKYGPFDAQVLSIEVVLADGSVRRLKQDTRPPLEWFAHSEGTLGVVTEVELMVCDTRPMRHALVACSSIGAVCELASRLAACPVLPYAIHFDDGQVLSALAALGYSPAGWQTGELVRVDWEGSPEELDALETVIEDTLAAVHGTRRLSAEAANAEWEARFKVLRLKRGGPSVVGAEILLPLSGVEGYLRDVEVLAHRQRTKFMNYGHVASVNTAIVMTMCYCDETRLLAYLLDLGLVKKVHDIGFAHGGAPYGLGFWNTPHLRSRVAELPPAEQLQRKGELDPAGVMNPGKGIAGLALTNPTIMRWGMEALATVNRASQAVRR